MATVHGMSEGVDIPMDIMSLADLVSTLTPDHLPKPAARSPDRPFSAETGDEGPKG